VETLAAALSEQRDVPEEVIEPYLIQQGLLQRTPRGRMLTSQGFSYLGMKPTARVAAQLDMLGDTGDPDADPAAEPTATGTRGGDA
jgi:Holliday junction DNA helicase RuvB